MSKKRDRAELEARRLEGARLLRRGAKPVARRLKVSRTSVWRWEQALMRTAGGPCARHRARGARRN